MIARFVYDMNLTISKDQEDEVKELSKLRRNPPVSTKSLKFVF